MEGDPTHPVNRGKLCSKGMNLHYTVMDQSDRLLYPQLRMAKDQPRLRVGWDEAMEHAASVFKKIIRTHGPDAVGFYISGQCLTEEYYIINKLVKGFIGTNNIDTNSRLCMSSAVSAYKLSLGEDAVPGCYEDIESADCLLIAGANPAWCHPIIFRRIEAHKARNPQIRIIVVDPRKTQTAAVADLHLQINPGTDIVLYNAIARGLIENNFIDEGFIAAHTEGFEAMKQQVMTKTLQEAAAICGIRFTDIYRAVKYIGASGGFITMWAMGLNQSVVGVNKNLALINLSLITGKIGKPGSGPFSLTGQPNAMGGREAGGMATLLPAHRDPGNPVHRREVADYWGVASVPERPGLTATAMIEALHNGNMKAIWIICTNPAVSMPDAHLTEEALARAEFVVVQDISSGADTVKHADLLLPAAGWLEKEGTMTNSERRISYLPKLVDAPGEALPDADIIRLFAAKMGWAEKFHFGSASDIYTEHAGLTRHTRIDISGLSHERLQTEGPFQWPVPHKTAGGTARLFTDQQFYTATGKAKLHAPVDENHSEKVSPEFPFILTTGRIRDQWHSMTKTGKVTKLNQHSPRPFLEIHPQDAEKAGIREGDQVTVSNARGNVTVTAGITDSIKKGVVFLPMHWGKTNDRDFTRANNLTSMLADPVSRQPDLKFAAVTVTKYVKPAQKIIIAGSDLSVFHFAAACGRLNTEDELHVFAEEPGIFYDSSILTGYVTGERRREEGIKTKEELASAAKNIRFHPGKILQIDRGNKMILDDKGNSHGYDILILAPAGRPELPGEISATSLPGVFCLDSPEEADRIKAGLSPGDEMVIAGEGAACLRLATGLQKKFEGITVLSSGTGLLERQLDSAAEELLKEVLSENGIIFVSGESITGIASSKRELQLKLLSGRILACRALIYIPVRSPDAELAGQSGLLTGDGICVNECFQTSDPSIYAIGPSAAFRGECTDTAGAREQQAGILANWLQKNRADGYQASLKEISITVNDWKLSALGLVTVPAGRKGFEEIFFMDRFRRQYKKCLIYRDRLVGAILAGDQSECDLFREWIAEKTELGEKRAQLLGGGQAGGKAVLGKLVCSCNSVGEGNLQQSIREGCNGVDELCRATGAGMRCGSCRPEVKMIWDLALLAI